ncbi:hypothetical protein B0H13DRAFT_2461358 [Mycena leptocephala]|nr:hypothetical protein B0H13DRAFT_2461358 [Mycena leptocephala]
MRPKCGQCLRSSSFKDCEYADGRPTRTQILQEQITTAEARIGQLEKPELAAPILPRNLHVGTSGSASPRPLSRGGSSYLILRIPSAQNIIRSGTLLGAIKPDAHAYIVLGGEGSYFQSFSKPKFHLGNSAGQVRTLHSSQFGFFLNVHNFRESGMGRSGQRPAAVLLHIVSLWAIHLSGSDEFTAHEARYLSRALRTAVETLSGTQNNTSSGTHYGTVLHTIQAEVLLASYFFRNTRFLEGKYHLSAAVSLVISSGLHRIRSSAPGGPSGTAFHALVSPRDPMEECERIAALWTVVTLDSCWTTADGSPSNISYTDPNARIDTPWPLDINAPGFNVILPRSNIGTVTNFLANRQDSGMSVSALHAKAAILFEQASCLSSQYRPNMENRHQFYVSFNSIDLVIERFKLSLPTVQLNATREMLVIHCLVHVAAIQLHNPFVADTHASRLRMLDAARAIVAYLAQVPLNEFVYIDPIMGTLLMATCQVFVAELRRYRRHRSPNTPSVQERSLMEATETVLAAMNVFSPRCRLMESQLVAMQQLYNGQ